MNRQYLLGTKIRCQIYQRLNFKSSTSCPSLQLREDKSMNVCTTDLAGTHRIHGTQCVVRVLWLLRLLSMVHSLITRYRPLCWLIVIMRTFLPSVVDTIKCTSLGRTKNFKGDTPGGARRGWAWQGEAACEHTQFESNKASRQTMAMAQSKRE